MAPNYILNKKLNLILVPLSLFLLASCGSYQYSGYETDGIYSDSRPGIWEEQRATEVKPNSGNSYYKNLFAQQSEMVGEILESDVFTDVDSYSSNDGYEDYSEIGGDVAYVGGNAPWGNDPDTYTVNFYNNGFGFGYGYGFGYGFGYPGYYGFHSPYIYGPRWHNPYLYGIGPSFGFSSFGHPYWYWGSAFSFGYGGFYGGYGYGYGYPYYGGYGYPYYGGGYGYNNNVAYNTGRRNSTVYYRDGENRRSTTSRYNSSNRNRNSSYSRSIREIRNNRTAGYNSRARSSADYEQPVYTRTNRRSQSSRVYDYNQGTSRNPGTYRGTPTRRSSNNRSYTPSTSRRSSSTRSPSTRSSSSSRSSGTSVRSSSGSRSSGSRSSGSRSSGSRSSRGGRGGI